VTGGDLIGKSSRAIEDYRRQAEVFLRSRQFAKAEQTLKNALELHPNHPQLLAALGHVYARSAPQRIADARATWQRAYELGSKDRRVYLAWTRLEEQQNEWQKMLDVAERGLKRVGEEDPALLQQAGYAASRLAQSLQASFNSERAKQEFSKSDDLLYSAIRSGKRNGIDRHFISRSYRAWIVNAAVQGWDSEICRRLKHWLEWDPADEGALEEAERQGNKCPEVVELLGRLS
jgi:tetratricopeptide (TPR) repeat protein